MLRYLSETTEEERLHVKRGTIDLLDGHMKMRFVAPGDWIRIKLIYNLWFGRLVVKPTFAHGCRQGELLQMVYFRP